MYCKRQGNEYIPSLCLKKNGQIIGIDCRKSMDTQLSMQKGKNKGHSLTVFCKKKKKK